MASMLIAVAQLALALAICVVVVLGVMLLTVAIYRAGLGELLDVTDERRTEAK